MKSIYWFRFALLGLFLVLGLEVLRHPRKTWRMVSGFLLPTRSPLALGMLRATIFLYICRAASSYKATLAASQPRHFLKWPPGWHFTESFFPPEAETVAQLEGGLVVLSFLAAIGLFSRLSVPLAGALAPLVLGIPNLYGKVNHGHHVVILCAMILAAAPAGHGFSVDRWIHRARGGSRPKESPSYGSPLRFAWLMLALSYFFAGMWKVWDAGDLYFNGKRLKSELFEKWAALEDFVPLVRPDHYPLFLKALGGATIIFELGLIFALLRPASRVLGAFVAFAFHFGVWSTMAIRFKFGLPLILLLDSSHVAPCLPWYRRQQERLVKNLPAGLLSLKTNISSWLTLNVAARWPASPYRAGSNWATFVVGTTLVIGMLGTGFFSINTQPVSIFPKFSSRATHIAKRGSRTQLLLVRGDGAEEDISKRSKVAGRLQRRWLKELKRLNKRKNRKKLQRRTRRFVKDFRPRSGPIQPGDTLKFVKRTWPADPAKRAGKVRSKVLFSVGL